MLLKQDWEQTSSIQTISDPLIRQMISQFQPDIIEAEYIIISGGCANLNIKFQATENYTPKILRIYLHDQTAPYREQKIGQLLADTIPVPQIQYIGQVPTYTFVIVNYIEGISLRSLLLDRPHENIAPIMTKVGSMLGRLRHFTFSNNGFLDKNLHVTQPFSPDFIDTLLSQHIHHPTVKTVLESQMIDKIQRLFAQLGDVLKNNDDRHLVHGDFDPANIFVQQTEGEWSIRGILDWEFAHAGTMLVDMANMLRYAHLLPPAFQDGFISGLQQAGVVLPDHWSSSVRLYNILALLECLARSSVTKMPNRIKDIKNLIDYLLKAD